LGYQFSPRLADIGGTRFWRVDGKADYGALDGLASQRINVALIVQHWEDLLRLAGSLKLGTFQAAGLIPILFTLRGGWRRRHRSTSSAVGCADAKDSRSSCA